MMKPSRTRLGMLTLDPVRHAEDYIVLHLYMRFDTYHAYADTSVRVADLYPCWDLRGWSRSDIDKVCTTLRELGLIEQLDSAEISFQITEDGLAYVDKTPWAAAKYVRDHEDDE